MMHAEIDDNEVHLDHAFATDNARRARHARDNRVGIVCHTLAFVSTVILVVFEYETEMTLHLLQS